MFHTAMLYSIFILTIITCEVVSLSVNLIKRGLSEIPIAEISTQVTKLNLNHNDLTSLEPRVFEHHTEITTLNVQFNHINTISSEAFYGITSLQKLHMRNNKLSEFPDLSEVSSSLTHLYLRDNDITSKHLNLITMTEMIELDLERNKITHLSFSSFRYIMPKLETLNLERNQISEIDVYFFIPCVIMETLILRVNEITQFNPITLNISRSIIYIDLSTNKISELGNGSFVGFHNLTTLNLDDNLLKEFDVGKLTDNTSMDNLVNLHLYGNELTEIPSTELLPEYMQTLSIGGNNIASIPQDFYDVYKNVTDLNLGKMDLTQFPVFTSIMYNLEILTLNENDINHFHITKDLIKTVSNLKQLYLKHNNLISLTENSNCIQNITLENMETLDFEWNNIAYISGTYFCQTPKLQILRLNNNKLVALDIQSDLIYLREINVNGNDLTEFPKLGLGIQNVEAINSGHNKIKNVSLASIYGSENTTLKSTSLHNLHLHYNYGINILNGVYDTMVNIRHLYLHNTHIRKFPDLSAFTELHVLHLQGNLLTEITDQDLAPLKQNTQCHKVHLQDNEIQTIGNLLELADSITAPALHVHLNRNNLQCDARLCWMKNMTL